MTAIPTNYIKLKNYSNYLELSISSRNELRACLVSVKVKFNVYCVLWNEGNFEFWGENPIPMQISGCNYLKTNQKFKKSSLYTIHNTFYTPNQTIPKLFIITINQISSIKICYSLWLLDCVHKSRSKGEKKMIIA